MAQKRPFSETKSAVERARRLQMQRNLFVVMRMSSLVILSHLDAGFGAPCPRRDFLVACLLLLLLLLLSCAAHPWTLTRGVKPRQGKPSSVIKTRTSLGERIGNHHGRRSASFGDVPQRSGQWSGNTAQKRLIFTSNWTTAWHHSMVHAILNTHLPSFDSPLAMKEQRPSLQTPTWHNDDRLEISRRLS